MPSFNKNSGYGQLMGQLPFLGSGKAFFVGDSGTANRNMLEQIFGFDPDGKLRLYDDIDEAISACTADAGDVVYVMPGHAETVTAAGGIAFDIAGITVVGLGNGDDRPTITFATNATASTTVTATDCALKGSWIFKCNVASQNHMFDITADDFTIDGLQDGAINIDFQEGTQTGLSFVTADTADGDSDYLKIRGCRFYAPTAGNYAAAIQLGKDFTGVRIEDCDIYGNFDNGSIEIPTAGNAQIDVAIRRCRVVNLLAGAEAIDIEGTGNTGEIADCRLGTDAQATALDDGGLRVYNTTWTDTTDQTIAVPVFVQPDSAANILGADDADNLFASTNTVANEDGSVLERLEQVQEAINKGTGTALAANESLVDVLYGANGIVTYPAAAVPGNGISIAEVLRDAWDALRNGTGGAEPATNRSVMDYLGATPAFSVPGLGFAVTKTSDLASAAGVDDLFTITGKVKISLIEGEVTTVVATTTTMKLRVKTDNVDLCAATTITADADGTHYLFTGVASETLNGGITPVLRVGYGANGNITPVVIGDASGTATLEHVLDGAGTGAVLWTLYYMPLEAGASVAAAA